MADLERTLSHGVVQHPLPPEDAATFPQLTQAGSPTEAYLETSATGLVLAREAEAAVSTSPTSDGRRGSHSTLVGGNNAKATFDLEKQNQLLDAKLVTWKENDPENPREWTKKQKWIQTFIPTALCWLSGFGSSVVTGGLPEMAEHYHVSELVMNLIVCVFVVGFGAGPMLLSPLSEMYGRRGVYIACTWLYFIFTLPGCLTDSLAVMIIFRFFAGCAASACMCNAAGSIGDLWTINERGNKMVAFSVTIFAAPCLGPLIGGYITICTGSGSEKGWRNLWWLLFATCGFFALIATIFLRETYNPTLLKNRAAKLRKETGDVMIMTEQERQGRPVSEVAKETLLRPVVMLTTEAIMICMSGYLMLVYSLLYSLFFAYPIVFVGNHGFNAGEVGLCFLSVLVGICLACLVAMPIQEAYYQRQVVKHNGHPPPETRLPLMMVGCVVLPAAEFIFAATSIKGVHWAGPLISGIPFGFSLVAIYNAANTYIAVAFSEYSASAMAAKTLARSLAGASIPMWLGPMYKSIGNWWAGATFAFISLAMCPIPFIFFFYGAKIRSRSKMAS
ncbi:hypothetical protein JCM11251_003304 [Rhodosporidiobolus azoricus]